MHIVHNELEMRQMRMNKGRIVSCGNYNNVVVMGRRVKPLSHDAKGVADDGVAVHMPVLFQLSNALEDRICLSAGRLANNALV